MSLVDLLEFIPDSQPRSASLNMAVDEVIMKEISVPVLRVYRWLHPAVSFGCFEKYFVVERRHPGCELVRRWTGGGVVPHGEDFTYSLMVPRDCPLGKMGPAQSYLAIHQALVQTLREAGIPASMTNGDSPCVSNACFENAVCHDIVIGGRKIAGAAQRRTRLGLLHQGSIQGVALPGAFAERLASKLAIKVIQRALMENELSAAMALAESKYAAQQWTRKF